MVGALGIFLGALFGALPGLGPSTAVALLLPFAIVMSPLNGMVFVLCAYTASNYGGSIPAVLIGVPGDPGSAPTIIDGFPMTQNGRAPEALALVATGSTLASIFGLVVFWLFAPSLARMGLSFGPPEFFLLIFLGLTVLITLDVEHLNKGLFAGLLGLALGTVGLDTYWAEARMIFGQPMLYDGFPILPALLGIFSVSQMLFLIDEKQLVQKDSSETFGLRSTIREMVRALRYWRTIGLSSVIGVFVGALPGAGAAIASFVAYNFAKLTSKTPEKFGKGIPEGVIAPEAANNAQVGGSLIPTFALGIPGNPTTAIFLGAMMLLGLRPGPTLFITETVLLNTLIGYLLLCTVFILIFGAIGARYFHRVTNVPLVILAPIVIIISSIGAFSVRSLIFDVGIMLGFGVLSYVLGRFRYSLAALSLGFILGPLAEVFYIQSMAMSAWSISIFFTRPISIALIIVIALSVGASLMLLRKIKRNNLALKKPNETQ
ncbi:MAG: tripartite tricarboxylate transporter permease [Devosiaceae bacterium]|nr:tripartite tricarboxylate transporter permease [Devosiaceae bacterium]